MTYIKLDMIIHKTNSISDITANKNKNKQPSLTLELKKNSFGMKWFPKSYQKWYDIEITKLANESNSQANVINIKKKSIFLF